MRNLTAVADSAAETTRIMSLLLGAITAAECAAWLTETLAPERLALSVVAPKGGEDDADDDA